MWTVTCFIKTSLLGQLDPITDWFCNSLQDLVTPSLVPLLSQCVLKGSVPDLVIFWLIFSCSLGTTVSRVWWCFFQSAILIALIDAESLQRAVTNTWQKYLLACLWWLNWFIFETLIWNLLTVLWKSLGSNFLKNVSDHASDTTELKTK